jgi:hypothetical protein
MKAYIVDKMANKYNPFNSDFFIYVDTGSFRERIYKNWPNMNFIEKLKLVIKDKVLLGLVNPVRNESNMNVANDHIQVGSKQH